jgi:uncharacterized protein (TIGR02300 family)
VPDLGKKYTCYSCHTKFYDLGKAVPICPKCGADQRDAEEAPVVTSSRGRGASRAPAPPVVEEPIEDEFGAEAETPATESEEDEELIVEPEREEEEAEEEDEGDEY